MANNMDVYEDTNQLVPFGKYKGQPVSVLASDPNYCNWMMSQEGIKQRYPVIYNLIINNFTKPEDTPEHNKLQAKFLDEMFLNKCLWLLNPKGFEYGVYAEKSKVKYEVHGWDVHLGGLSSGRYEEDSEGNTVRVNWDLYFELKPEIGDDYPTVMREMNFHRNVSEGRFSYLIEQEACVLVYDKYTGVGIDEMQMRKMFEASGYHVFKFDEIDSVDEKVFKDKELVKFNI